MFTRVRALLAAVFVVAGICSVAVTLPATTVYAEDAAPAAAPAAAAPGNPDAMAAENPSEEKENPYGFAALWKNGDAVARGTLVILFIMSMGTWYVMVTKLFEQSKLLKQAAEMAKSSFWSAKHLKDGIDSLKQGSAFKYIAESALAATEHHGGMLGHIDFNDWVTMGIQRAVENVQNRLQDGLALLATVGSTAPFIGLFGTVWGIYHALTAIGIAGQASIDKVAGPVGEALIMTAIGLAVAVPAVLGYNWLVRRNKVSMEKIRAFGSDLHSVVLGAKAKSDAGKL